MNKRLEDVLQKFMTSEGVKSANFTVVGYWWIPKDFGTSPIKTHGIHTEGIENQI